MLFQQLFPRPSDLIRMLLCLPGLFCAGAVYSEDSSDQKKVTTTVAEYLQSEKELAIFLSALQTSRYWSDIKLADAITLFVPTNKALRNEGSAFLLEAVLNKPENKKRLDSLTGIHIVTGNLLLSRASVKSESVLTVSDDCVAIESTDNAVKVGPEAMLTTSVSAKNGQIYLIDRLLWAPYQQALQSKDCQ